MQREEEAAADVEDESEDDSEDDADDGSDVGDEEDADGGSEDEEDEDDEDEEVGVVFSNYVWVSGVVSANKQCPFYVHAYIGK